MISVDDPHLQTIIDLIDRLLQLSSPSRTSIDTTALAASLSTITTTALLVALALLVTLMTLVALALFVLIRLVLVILMTHF